MSFLGKLLVGIGVEFKGIFGALRHLRWPFWLSYGMAPLLALAGLYPSPWLLPVQGFLLLAIGAMAISRRPAAFIRRRRWVNFPNGPQVAPYLSPLLTVLAFPPFLLTMAVLFWQTGQCYPSVLAVTNWTDALALTAENFLQAEIFFDAFAIFHIHLAPLPSDFAGNTLLLVSRLLMDFAFIKLVFQVLNAAVYRARGLGNGEDKLFQLHRALDAEDVTNVRSLSQSVGDSLRDAVDTLRGHVDARGQQTLRAWQCLVAIRDFALPYLESRFRLMTGDEQRQVGELLHRLRAADEKQAQEPRTSARSSRGLLLGLALLTGVTLPFTLGTVPALSLSLVMMALLAWMVVGARGWIDRLVTWRVLQPIAPNRLPRQVAVWSLALLPLLVLTAGQLFLRSAALDPSVFGMTTAEQVNYPSALAYVLENLLRIQLFADTFEIYELRIAPLEAVGFLGGLLTLFTRATFDLGILALVVTYYTVWFNRVFRRFQVSPNAELILREEATECGPHAALLLSYHYREIEQFVVVAIRHQYEAGLQAEGRVVSIQLARRAKAAAAPIQDDGSFEMENTRAGIHSSLFTALAESGFLAQFQTGYSETFSVDRATACWHCTLYESLYQIHQFTAATTELRQAITLWEQLTSGRHDQDDLHELGLCYLRLGMMLKRAGDLVNTIAYDRRAIGLFTQLAEEQRSDNVDNAATRRNLGAAKLNLGLHLAAQGKWDQAITEYEQAVQVYRPLIDEGRTEVHRDLAALRRNLAAAWREQGEFARSIDLFHEALSDYAQSGLVNRPDVRGEVAGTHALLGTTFMEQGLLPQEAEAEFRRAIEMYEQLCDEGCNEYHSDLAGVRGWLGLFLQRQERFSEAIEAYNYQVALYGQLIRDNQTDLYGPFALVLMNRGLAFEQQGSLDQAGQDYHRAIAIYERLVHEEHRLDLLPELANTQMNYGLTLRRQGKLQQAVEMYRRAIKALVCLIDERQRGDLEHLLAHSRTLLGAALREQGKLAESAAELREAVDRLTELVRAGQVHRAVRLLHAFEHALATALAISRDAAAPLVTEAFAVFQELLPHRKQLPEAVLREIHEFMSFASNHGESEGQRLELASLARSFVGP
jgi:tetratricopeptide (TPR) repeat protein